MPNLKEMWQRGASYEELHRIESPHSNCECDYCEMMRCLEEWDEWAWKRGLLPDMAPGEWEYV